MAQPRKSSPTLRTNLGEGEMLKPAPALVNNAYRRWRIKMLVRAMAGAGGVWRSGRE